jgi:hypothetical protein
MGDPAGIGPEVAVKALSHFLGRQRASFLIVGAPQVMDEAIARFGSSRLKTLARALIWQIGRGLDPAAATRPLTLIAAGDFPLAHLQPDTARVLRDGAEIEIPIAEVRLGDTIIARPGEPLLVDCTPDTRGDLEVAMRRGLLVVQYDCKTIRVLNDCYVEGQYDFSGMTTKEQVVRLADADEILVFEHGRIIERGTFDALAKGTGLFARMVAEGGFTVPELTEG